MHMIIMVSRYLGLAMPPHNAALCGMCTFKAVTQNQDSISIFPPFAFKLQDDELIRNSQGHYTELEKS